MNTFKLIVYFIAIIYWVILLNVLLKTKDDEKKLQWSCLWQILVSTTIVEIISNL